MHSCWLELSRGLPNFPKQLAVLRESSGVKPLLSWTEKCAETGDRIFAIKLVARSAMARRILSDLQPAYARCAIVSVRGCFLHLTPKFLTILKHGRGGPDILSL